MKEDIKQLLRDSGGVIRRAEHPATTAHRLDRLRSRGELVSLLPGVLVPPAAVQSWEVRLAAGLAWVGPDAVVTRHSAARMTFWRDCPEETIELAVARTPPRPRAGWVVTKSHIPPEMTWQIGTTKLTSPAYTAVDLAADKDGSDVIDRVLRSRQAKLDELWQVLAAMPGRPGNQTRAAILRDSRDAPWSELERRGHRLLRQHRITGWRTNVWVEAGPTGYYVDVLFRRARLVVEFDGWEYHSDRAAFENDRRRRNELVLAGYMVLNFTWLQVTEDPEWVIRCVHRALRRIR